MKKGLIALVVIIGLVVAGGWYLMSGAGDFIRAQIEKQGSEYLGTQVSVFSVDLALSDGRISINDLDVENPAGFSKEDAFSLESITLDLGNMSGEPYVIQTVSVNAPEVLYELDASGQGNLIVLKNNLQAKLPKGKAEPEPTTSDTANPLVIVENVSVSGVKLKVNFDNLDTGEFTLDKKAYEVTLPTFSAGSIGKPNGMPADQVGAAVVNAMLDNVIASAKAEAKKILKDKAREKLNEKVEEEKGKLMEKANEKLKGLFDK